MKRLVASIGRMEKLLAQRDPKKEPKLVAPLSGLDPAWFLHADDGSVEVRIAAALASIRSTGEVGPIRANLAPVDPKTPWAWASGGFQVAWAGANLPDRMVSVLSRRMMDGARLDCRENPTFGSITLHRDDVAAFIEGDLDENLLEDLLFGFLWVKLAASDDSTKKEISRRWAIPVRGRIVSRSYALLRLLFLSAPLEWAEGVETSIRPESSILPLLRASRVTEAVRVAQRRLKSSGLSPVSSEFPESANGLRLAASLLIPIRNPMTLAKLVLSGNDSR